MKALLSYVAVFVLVVLSQQIRAACPSPQADQSIAILGHPFAAEPTPDNCNLFVSFVDKSGQGALEVFSNDNGTFRHFRTVSIAHNSVGGLSLSHNGTLLAFSAGDVTVLLEVAKLKTSDQEPIVGVISEGGHGAIIPQFSSDDALLFVSEERNSSIAVVEVSTVLANNGRHSPSGQIPVGQGPVGLTVSADGKHLYATSQIVGDGDACQPEQNGGVMHAKGALLTIDVALAKSNPRRAVANMVSAGCNPVRVVVSSDGHSLWVSQRGDGRILGLDPTYLDSSATKLATSEIVIGGSPVGLALRPDGAQLWVASSERFQNTGGRLTLIEPGVATLGQPTKTIQVGRFPRNLGFMPDGKTLIVTLFGDNAVLLHPTQ